jgi:hypothetical protein
MIPGFMCPNDDLGRRLILAIAAVQEETNGATDNIVCSQTAHRVGHRMLSPARLRRRLVQPMRAPVQRYRPGRSEEHRPEVKTKNSRRPPSTITGSGHLSSLRTSTVPASGTWTVTEAETISLDSPYKDTRATLGRAPKKKEEQTKKRYSFLR